MAVIVLTADQTLMSDYRDLPLATFFSCIPNDYVLSRLAYKALAPPPEQNGGIALRAPYGLRKFESILMRRFKPKEVVVALPNHIERFIGPETKMIGVHAMDPLGLGPVSMTFTMGGRMTPYTKASFTALMEQIRKMRPPSCKVAVGGTGTWQFDSRPNARSELGIDHVVSGELEKVGLQMVDAILSGNAPPIMKAGNAQAPSIEEIPAIRNASMHGLVEVMRGCPRGCLYCEAYLRRLRNIPPDLISKEIKVNAKSGLTNASLHSDDFFLYGVEDMRTLVPNREAVVSLFQIAMSIPGILSAAPTHGTVSAAVADPLMIEEISRVVRAGPKRWVGVQCGLETGSPELIKSTMTRKALPFSAEEWSDILVKAVEIFNRNYWYPAFTVMMGLPGETSEDAWATVDLIDRLESVPGNRFIIAPLSFVPVGVLKGKEFFNVDAMVDEANYNVAYRCWRHLLLEMDAHLWSFSRMSFIAKVMINMVGRAGGRYIMKFIERYGRLKGFEIRKPGTVVASSRLTHAGTRPSPSSR